ncbi:peptidoglycan editing factor PgeF [Sediminihaliea albiluteola]|uniref:peptidoglycan editing factor PgeF n=1 Tax=Sediminihaliea albiluteola TaxID=2758564 RepID=UPI001C70B7E3|nr:peptidoglycan editing factor PgeF [Sediminihaliea albiluteola]
MSQIELIEADWPAPAGVRAFCSTRQGGYSEGAYTSLNLAQHVDDRAAAVSQNRALLAASLGEEVGPCQWLQQVHGSAVVQLPSPQPEPIADACWTTQRALPCAVLTADCLPVLFCDQSATVVAAAHAGWRGLLDGVLEATVSAMATDATELLAWLGPAIGPAAFEVGPELRAMFLARAKSSAEHSALAQCFRPAQREQHYLADLYALARISLSRMGVQHIYGGEACTYSDSQRFFSYRRDGETGRMASVIALLP